MLEIIFELFIEIRKRQLNHVEIETGQNIALRFALKEKSKRRIDALNWGGTPSGKPLICLIRQGHAMMRFTRRVGHRDVEHCMPIFVAFVLDFYHTERIL